MLTVVTFRWRPYAGYRSEFPAAAVNTLAKMVRRHYRGPNRFVCFTDDPRGIGSGVEVKALWDDLADVPNPSGARRNPSCYRRLKLFDPAMRELLGERILCLDLDMVITGDVTPLWDRPEDFVAWGDTRYDNHYNGSMFLLRAGALPQVWEDFHPKRSPREARDAGYFGSDQGWLSYKLRDAWPRWTAADGVYSYRNHIAATGQLPADARIVSFHGHVDPWDADARRLAWVRKHYR